MSRLGRVVRRIFRPIRRFFNSTLGRALIIAGAVFFTGGLAAGGFAAFGAVGSATGAAKIPAFFGAVGQTIAQGATAIAGSLGFGSAAAQGGGSVVGLTGGSGATGMLSQQAGLLQAMGAGVGAVTPAVAPAATGILARMGAILKPLTGSTVGQLAIAQGIMGGIQSFAAGREARRQEKRHDSDTVWGARRRGGGGENFMETPQLATSGETGPNRPPTPAEWRESQGQQRTPPTPAEWRESQGQQRTPADPASMAFQNPLLPRQTTTPGILNPDDDWGMPQPVQPAQGILYA